MTTRNLFVIVRALVIALAVAAAFACYAVSVVIGSVLP